MKIKKLIEILSQLDQEMDVFVSDKDKPLEKTNDLYYLFKISLENKEKVRYEGISLVMKKDTEKNIWGGCSLGISQED